MNKTLLSLGATILVGCAATGQAFAVDSPDATSTTSTATPATAKHHHKGKSLDKMEHRTDKKIAKGEASGKLSASEATALKQRQTQIESEKSQVATQSNGHMTKGEAKHIKHEERDLNKQLKRDLKS